MKPKSKDENAQKTQKWTMQYMQIVNDPFAINDTKDLILDTIALYGLSEDGIMQDRVNFCIYNKDGEIMIFPDRKYNKYLLLADRVVDVDVNRRSYFEDLLGLSPLVKEEY